MNAVSKMLVAQQSVKHSCARLNPKPPKCEIDETLWHHIYAMDPEGLNCDIAFTAWEPSHPR